MEHPQRLEENPIEKVVEENVWELANRICDEHGLGTLVPHNTTVPPASPQVARMRGEQP